MDDIEKSRAAYVAQLEASLKHCQAQLQEAQAAASKWKPVCAGEITTNGEVRVTLAFGGKNSTAVVAASVLSTVDPTTAISAVVDTLIESNVAARLREEIAPEVIRLQQNALSLQKVNKW